MYMNLKVRQVEIKFHFFKDISGHQTYSACTFLSYTSFR